MSTRPRTPAPGAPAPGKLPITELLGMKESGSPIAMITAYDAPSGRLADAAGADMILVGDSAAMTMLGHDSTVPGDDGGDARADARGDARRPAPARRRRHAVRLLPGLRRARGDERDPLRQGRRRRRRQARGRGHDALARARHRRSRDPGDGAHRPDAAVGDRARRLQGAGPHGGEGGAARPRRARARGGRLLLARARGGSLARRREDHRAALDPDDRDRCRAGRRRPGARLARPARPLRRPRPAVREAVRAPRGRDPAGRRGVRR